MEETFNNIIRISRILGNIIVKENPKDDKKIPLTFEQIK
jgi:hypothetical protein